MKARGNSSVNRTTDPNWITAFRGWNGTDRVGVVVIKSYSPGAQ
jgi:hypothetical protein